MVPSAYLRVFQPLDAFEREEQAHWERYLVEGAHDRGIRPRYADRPTVGSLGMLAPSGGEHAEVRVVEGRTYLSPLRTRMRVLASMLAFREAEPHGAVGAVRAQGGWTPRRARPSADAAP